MILPPFQEQGKLSEEERELDELLSQCVRCASCLPTCPTFLETLDEGHSPRGRISLVRALNEGEGDTSKSLNSFLYGCLECRACETACPNNVIFHRIIEHGKESLSRTDLIPKTGKFFKWLFLKHIFKDGKKLNRFMAFLRFYKKSGLQALIRFTRLLKIMPWHLGDLEKLMPEKLGKHSPVKRKRDYTLIPAGDVRGTASFFTGCIADHWLQPANLATIRLLLRAGYAVTVPAEQECCGALHVHLGELEQGMELALKNISTFAHERTGSGPIVVNAAGCGAALKEYGHLLRRQDSEEDAKAFSKRITDLSVLLASILDDLPVPNALHRKVTYDDPCHMIHGQGVSAEPRRLIRFVPGLEFVELVEASWCCGSAGVYNLTNYEMSMEVLERKLKHVTTTGADILLTANPGCLLQLQAGVKKAKLDMEVLHLAEFLDRQYPEDPALSPEGDPPPWK